jgi:vesicle-fusing ATPase
MNVVIVHGDQYTGKTKLVAHAVKDSGVSCIKFVTPRDLISFVDRCRYINQIYDQCCKTYESVLVIDNIERMIEWSSSGARYDNKMVQTILTILNANTDPTKKITVIITANSMDVLEMFDIHKYADLSYKMPNTIFEDADFDILTSLCPGVKPLQKISEVFRYIKRNGAV